MAAKEEQFLLWYKDIGRKLANKYPTCTVAYEAFKAAMDIMEAAATSHNKQSTPCSCNAGTEYVPQSVRLCSKCGMPK